METKDLADELVEHIQKGGTLCIDPESVDGNLVIRQVGNDDSDDLIVPLR